MTAADPHLAELSAEERRVLESWLVDFDLTWDERRLKSWVGRLPQTGDRLRRAALVEMVKIDLEHRWGRKRPARLEAYVKALPELGPKERLSADLIFAEFEARRYGGARAQLADFARRFPAQAHELRRLVEHGEPGAFDRPPPEARRPTLSGESSPNPSVGGGVPPEARTPLPARLPRFAAAPPSKFGRYQILHTLGHGAMGAVYLAYDAQLDRRVALKIPQFSADDGPEIRQRFLCEARAAAAIEHPNICPVYEVGEIDGAPYLAMAYLQGQPLGRLLQPQTALPQRQAADLVRRLALALQEAHDHGVVHRDLKPSNIIINQRGEPVIVDFGLARRLRQGDIRLTRIGQPVGTPGYMSPEQVVGAVEQMGPACDVYSLGVILYQLLTGRLPFDGPIAEVLGQILHRPPTPPSHHRPDLNPRLEAACLKALSKNRSDRHASMKDFAAPLKDYLDSGPPPGAPVHPESLNPISVGGRDVRGPLASPRRNPLLIMLAVGGAAFLALAVGVVLLMARPKGAAPTEMGAVRIQLDDPHAEVAVRVDDERIERAALREPLRLRTGEHQLLVKGEDFRTVRQSFAVAPGDNPILRVTLLRREQTRGSKQEKEPHHSTDDDPADDR
jgi:predicted Ser/Thr protein kinase